MSQPPEPRSTEEQPEGGPAPDEGVARSGPTEPATTAEASGEGPPSVQREATEAPAGDPSAPSVDAAAEGAPPEPPSDDTPQGRTAGEASEAAGAAGEGEAAGAAGEGEASEAAGAAGEGEASEAAGAAGEGAPKKKKRRRKRKKKAASAEGEGGDGARSAPVPFGAFFTGAEARRHAFSTGEIVAGRVVQVAQGTILVDLFGKATAVVDEHEPHEVPPQPEPPEAPAPGPETSDPGAEASGDVPGGAPGAAPASPEAQGSIETEAVAGAEVAPGSGAGPSSDGEAGATQGAGAAAPEARSGADPVAPETSPAPTEAEAEVPSDPAAAAEAQPAAEVEPADAAAEDGPESAAEVEPAEDGPESAPAAPEPPPPEPPPVGAIFRGRIGSVAESGHVVIVNRVIDREAAKGAIAQAREAKRRVHGVVYGFNRGGFDVLVHGLRAFCPASAMALDPVEDPHAYVGRKLEFTLPPSKGGGGIIVSRRGILEREARKQAHKRLKSIQPGHRMVGVVTDVRDFGAFVDLGEGLEGMIHVSELSWQRELKPADAVKPGDEVVVRVLDVKPANRKERQGRVSLSMRAVEPDPWDEHAELLTAGAPRKGRVVRTTEFGAFVELAPGIDGLLHISELGRELKHASQALAEGDEIDVVIDRVDRKQRRISLSKLSPIEAQMVESGELDLSQRPRSMKPGSHITVLVERVDHGGIQVKVQGVLGRRGRGFIPNRELSGPQGGVDRKQLVPGHPLEVKIIGTDRDGGLRCSLKGRQLDEERRAVQAYRREASKQGLGTFGDLLRAKLGQDPSSGSS